MLVCVGALLLAGCNKDEVKVYDVPKEQAAAPAPAAAPMASQPMDRAPVAPPHWTVPTGWQEVPATGVRVRDLMVPGKDGQKAEVTIIPFPGSVGTEVDNVNRWRREIGLEPVAQENVTSESVQIGSDAGKLYDLAGAQNQTIAAVLVKDGTSWFFKLKGDKAAVVDAKQTFVQFLKSVGFDQASAPVAETAAPTSTPTAPTAEKTGPAWDVPASWHEQEASPMVLKSFSATDESGHKAVITISSFPGDVGGTLANVNRWRRQLGLAPIEEMVLDDMSSSIDVMGGKGTTFDMTGKDVKTGQPARMVAAMVPRDDSTWFYKLMGDDAVVAREKSAFVKFVQTVRY